MRDGVNVQFDDTQDIDNTGGAIVNGWDKLYLILGGQTTQFVSTQNRYINVYDTGGSSYLYSKGSNPRSEVPQPTQPEIKSTTFDCTGGKTFEVTYANTSRTGIQGINIRQVTSGNTDTGNPSDQVCTKHWNISTSRYVYSYQPRSVAEASGGDYEIVANSECQNNGVVSPSPTSSPASPQASPSPSRTSSITPSASTTVTVGTLGTDGCPASQVKISWIEGSGSTGTSCVACSFIPQSAVSTGAAGDFTFDTSNYATKCTTGSNEPVSNNPTFVPTATSAVNASGVTWKCLEAPPAGAKWFYRTTGGVWQQQNSTMTVSDPGTYEKPVSNCGSAAPTDKPTNASATTIGANGELVNSTPGCPTGKKCIQTNGVYECVDQNATLGPDSIPITDINKCSYASNSTATNQTAGPSLQDNPNAVTIPVQGITAQEQAALKKGRVAITAYRYSQAGTEKAGGKYVTVGGAKLRITGQVNTNNSVQAPANPSSTNRVFNQGVACGAWDSYKYMPGLRAFFKNTVAFDVMTPDNGRDNSTTQIIDLPVGLYTVQSGTAKTGLIIKDKFCFSVQEGQTTTLDALLLAKSSAEPPGINYPVSYQKTANGVNRYFANGLDWMYIPEAPYYGWQKVQQGQANNGYNTNSPIGYTQEGGIVPGIDPSLGIPGGSMAQLMRLCQASMNSNGSIDTSRLMEVGAVLGFLSGDSNNIGDRLGNALIGGGIGWAINQLTGGKTIDFNINLNTITDQCNYLNQVSVPFDCTGCYRGGYCPPGCTANNAGLQGLDYLSLLRR